MKLVRRYVSLLLPVQLLAACSAAPEAPPAAPPQSNVVAEAMAAPPPAARPAAEARFLVLAFGDSLYAGYGLEQEESFPAVLQRALAGEGIEARVVNAGVSGDTSAAGRQRLAFTLEGLDRPPDLAIVGLGGNDLLRGLPIEETRTNMEAILAELRRRGIPVLLTGMMAPRNLGEEHVRRFDALYPDLARRYGATLYPFFLDGVITDPALLLPDGIHPNAEGVRRIVRRVGPQVAATLETAARDSQSRR